MKGIIMVLISALTNALVLFYFKWTPKLPHTSMYLISIYLPIMVVLAGILLYKWWMNANNSNILSHIIYRDTTKIPISNDDKRKFWGKFLLAQIFAGYIGYYLTFVALPLLPTIWFSLLSYLGIIITFVFGFIFLKEKIDKTDIIGSIMIIIGTLPLAMQ
jgi:drug/metabolite transporter (DMT)-like permease